jgi:polysaccharide pyruvyl transferase WcaK-like protein
MPRVAVINDTAGNGHFGCQAVMSTIAEQCKNSGLEVVMSWPVDHDWRRHKAWLFQQRLDAIIVNGEGSIHHTDSRNKAAYLCEIAHFARNELKIPVVLINATLTEIGEKARHDLACFDAIYVRETFSRDYLSNFGLQGTVVPDLSVFSSLVQTRFPQKKDGILITDSVIETVSEKLENFARMQDAEFIQMEITKDKGRVGSVFERLRKRLVNPKTLSRPELVRQDIGLSPFFARIAGAEALLTGRFHSVMLSIAGRTPFMAMESNTPKISSVLLDVFGSTHRIIPPERLDDVLFGETWRRDVQFSQSEVDAIEQYLTQGRGKMKAMFNDIAARVHANRRV